MCDVVSVYYRWYTRYNKQRILHLHFAEHLRAPTITKVLAEEGIKTSRRGVLKLLQKHYHSKTITRLPGSGRRSLVTAEVKRIVEEKMRRDNEATDHQLHALLISKGFPISLRTILSCRTALGWTFRGSAYCQLIRTVNKVSNHTNNITYF